MEFYPSIAQWYDDIFPLNPQQVSFTLAHSPDPGNTKLLDIGCGSGSLAIALCKYGMETTGIDLDNELLKIAVKKTYNACQCINFRLADMQDLKKIFTNRKFNTIVCYGNTLPHLPDITSVALFFQSVNTLLHDNGKFLFQIINYDRIINQKIPGLPTIENEKMKFIRNYYPSSDNRYVHFETILTIKETKKEIVNKIPLLAIRSEELKEIARLTELCDLDFFGGFDGSAIDENAIPLIGICSKKS